MNYPCPQCSTGIAVVEATAGKTVQCTGCGSSVEVPRMATTKLTTRKDRIEGDHDSPAAIVASAGAEAATPPPEAAAVKPLAAAVKSRRQGVIIPNAVENLGLEPGLVAGEPGSPGNFTLKEPTQKPAREVKVRPALKRAVQERAARQFRGFRRSIEEAPVERISAAEAEPVQVRPRSKIGKIFGRARDFLLFDPELQKGPVSKDTRDHLLKDQYRLQEPTTRNAVNVDVRPIAKRGDGEVSGFDHVTDRFVPLHEFTEMVGFGEMSKEEQVAILQAQADMEQSRASSMNKRMFFSALVFAAPAVIAVTVLALHAMKSDDASAGAAASVGGADSPQSRIYSITDAKSLARKIDAAGTVEELAEFTRNPEASLPRMRRFYERVALMPNQLLDLHAGSAGEINLHGDEFIWLMATMKHGHADRMLALEKTGGGLKLDWESYVNYSEVPWTDFVDQQHPRRAEFRVTLARDDYYNHAFADESGFRCYKLTDPANLRTCYGYTPRVSQVAGVLEGSLGVLKSEAEETGVDIGRVSVKVIVWLRFPSRTPDVGQALIERVVCDSWVKP